jgi:hypothetical protein
VKKIGERVIRGKMEFPGRDLVDEDEKRINVFTGDFTVGVRITKFQIVSGDQSSTDGMGRLSTEAEVPAGILEYVDMSDTRQIAWASINGATDLTMVDMQDIVVRDNLVIEDLYFTWRGPTGVKSINYYIEADIYKLEPYQGSIAIVQNRSQG